jgi:hypothetical protein
MQCKTNSKQILRESCMLSFSSVLAGVLLGSIGYPISTRSIFRKKCWKLLDVGVPVTIVCTITCVAVVYCVACQFCMHCSHSLLMWVHDDSRSHCSNRMGSPRYDLPTPKSNSRALTLCAGADPGGRNPRAWLP